MGKNPANSAFKIQHLEFPIFQLSSFRHFLRYLKIQPD